MIRGAGEVSAQAAHGDGTPLARIPVDGDTGNTLDRFREVQVRKVRDVLGDDDVDHAGFATLGVEARVQAGAEAGDDDFINLGGVLRLSLRRGLRGGGADTQRQGDGQAGRSDKQTTTKGTGHPRLNGLQHMLPPMGIQDAEVTPVYLFLRSGIVGHPV